MSCTLTVKAPRKRKAQLDLTPLRDIVNGVMELCTDCHLASVDHKLNQLTLDMVRTLYTILLSKVNCH